MSHWYEPFQTPFGITACEIEYREIPDGAEVEGFKRLSASLHVKSLPDTLRSWLRSFKRLSASLHVKTLTGTSLS